MAGSYDALVVGCGPVGALLAARLGARGLHTLVVDRETAPYGLPRAVAADDEVQDLLDRAAPGLLDGAVQDVPVRFVGARGQVVGELRFPPGPSGLPGLVLFSQPALEERLRAHLATLSSVEVRLGTALRAYAQDDDGVTAELDDGTTVRADWLVGCDGARSGVRAAAGIGWHGRDLRRWLVLDAEGSLPGPDVFTYRCDPRGPSVDMPLPGGHRWEWLLDDGAPVPTPAVPDGVRVIRSVVYRYGARRASSWRSGRVLLAGDAAHTMPPFAGQGLGAGVRDAWALGELLPDRVEQYEPLRAPHVRAMTRLSLLLGAVLETRSPSAARARDALLGNAFRAPGVGPWLSRGGPRPTPSGVLDL